MNIRDKGQRGEREICDLLNSVIVDVHTERAIPLLPKDQLPFQRNQLQTAIGGSDISNPFRFSIEVKRQEQQSNINSWWEQCLISARKERAFPVLIWRKSRAKWKVKTLGKIEFLNSSDLIPIEISIEDFLKFFKRWYSIFEGNNK